MIGATPAFVHWFVVGFRETLAMIWLTWWPLVLGFGLSGLVQSLVPRDALRAQLGTNSPTSVAKATLLGILSSSCSYAASAMSRALFARGASWSNALIFMVASTNLVIELGVLLYLLLGWQFVLAQFVGGVVMVILLAFTTRIMFNALRQQQLKDRVLLDSPPAKVTAGSTWRERPRDRDNVFLAARYALGDLKMLRKELLAIYRRFYGGASTWWLFALLWFVMSVGGLVVNGLFHFSGLIPASHHVRALNGEFPLGATLVLNVLATLVLGGAWWLVRSSKRSARAATDPICGMTVE